MTTAARNTLHESSPDSEEATRSAYFRARPSSGRSFHVDRKVFAYVAITALVTLLIGWVPAQLSRLQVLEQRDKARANLRLSQLQNRLATAALDAHSGDFESARLYTSEFYMDLQAELANDQTALSPAQRDALKVIASKRDEAITLLARSDKTAGDRLSELYAVYVNATKRANGS